MKYAFYIQRILGFDEKCCRLLSLIFVVEKHGLFSPIPEAINFHAFKPISSCDVFWAFRIFGLFSLFCIVMSSGLIFWKCEDFWEKAQPVLSKPSWSPLLVFPQNHYYIHFPFFFGAPLTMWDDLSNKAMSNFDSRVGGKKTVTKLKWGKTRVQCLFALDKLQFGLVSNFKYISTS